MLEITGINPFPLEEVPRSKKQQRDWGLAAARAIQTRLLQGQTLFGIKDWDNFVTLRAYGDGLQDTKPLEDWFYAVGEDNSQNNSRIDARGMDRMPAGGGAKDVVRGARVFAKIDFSPISPMPKLKSTIISNIRKASDRVRCRSLNPGHSIEKAEQAWTLYYRSIFARKQAEKYDVALSQKPFEPRTPQQVEIMLRMNYFRLTCESAFEDLCQHTLDVSNWDEMEQKTMEDGIDLAFKCGKVDIDRSCGLVKTRYISPRRFVIQWDDPTEGRDATYVGHIETLKMYQVRPMLKKAGYKHKEIVELAQKMNDPTMKTYPSWAWERKDPTTNRWLWDELDVDILNFEYKSCDEFRYNKTETGFELIQNDNDRYTDSFHEVCVYEGKYILGTQALLEFGRKVNDCGEFSYFWDRIPGASITYRCRPLLDDLMKLIVKCRAEIWSAPPSGAYIDLSAIANIKLNPAQQQEYIQQAFAAFRQAGILTGQTVQRRDGSRHQLTPVQPLENGPKNLEKYAAAIAEKSNEILGVAGVPELLAATAKQEKGKAARIGDMEAISGTHAIFLQSNSVKRFKLAGARVALQMIRMYARFDEDFFKRYERIIGPFKMHAVKEVQEMSMSDLAMTLEVMPSQVEKEEMKLALAEGAKAGARNGIFTLTDADLLYLNRLINADQLELAEMYAANVTDERLAEHAKKEQDNIKTNAKVQTESAIEINKAEQETLKLKIQLEQEKGKVLQLVKDAGKMQQIELQGKIDQQNILLEASVTPPAKTGT